MAAKYHEERSGNDMKEKVKILSINTKKKGRKSKTSNESGKSMGDYMEELAPGMYSFSEVYACDAIKEVETLRPEIIWILQDALMDSSGLVKEIKSIHPAVAIFVMLFGVADDEQELMKKYSDLGAYKCYFLQPLVLDTLAHDMYVALNLE